MRGWWGVAVVAVNDYVNDHVDVDVDVDVVVDRDGDGDDPLT